MKKTFSKWSLIPIMLLSLFVACSSEITPIQAETSKTDANTQVEAVADVIQLENGDFLVEGDMILTEEQLVTSKILKKQNSKSALFPSNIYEWGENPTIEYYFVPADESKGIISMSTNAKNEFTRALKDLSNGVALSFKEVSTPGKHTVYVHTYLEDIPACEGASGCAYVGKVSESNEYNNSLWFSKNKAGLSYRVFFHEMMHVLGFHHEHQRADRKDSLNFAPGDIVTGDFLNTTFDMASIMLYDNVIPKNNVKDYEWLGSLPLPSSSDKVALKRKFGSETTTIPNHYYIKHSSGKFLCRSAMGPQASVVLNSSKSDLCIWDIKSGTLNLQKVSADSDIQLETRDATTIKSPERLNNGNRLYLSYQAHIKQFSLKTSAAGDLYASKWIFNPNHTRETVLIWNPTNYTDNDGDRAKGLCLRISNETLEFSPYSSERVIGYYTTKTELEWNLIPIWNTSVAY